MSVVLRGGTGKHVSMFNIWINGVESATTLSGYHRAYLRAGYTESWPEPPTSRAFGATAFPEESKT